MYSLTHTLQYGPLYIILDYKFNIIQILHFIHLNTSVIMYNKTKKKKILLYLHILQIVVPKFTFTLGKSYV